MAGGNLAMTDNVTVRVLDAAALDAAMPALCAILCACVHAGASVSFMLPMTQAKAEGFWTGVRQRVAQGGTVLLLAEHAGAAIGTAQLILDLPENQPHRAEIAKVLVHPSARRLGAGRVLMREIERQAQAAGRRLLVLDTISDGAGEMLYRSLGWEFAGSVPDFALMPDGTPAATSYFYKRLG